MDATKIAKMYLRNLQMTHRPVHEFRVVSASDFRHVNKDFYRRTESEFVELGFSKLGDIEDVNLAKYGKPAPRAFIRVMVDRDRTTGAGFFHFAPIWPWRIALWVFGFPSKCVELQSHSTDGGRLTTSNATKRAELPRPNTFVMDYAPRDLTPMQLYERHCQALANSGRQYNRVYTIEDAIREEIEQQARRREHLVSIGWVTPEYIAAQGCPESMIPSVYAESQRLLGEGFDASLDS
jgi:hypothetical protein